MESKLIPVPMHQAVPVHKPVVVPIHRLILIPMYRQIPAPKITVSQDVQSQFSVQLAFAKFVSQIKVIFQYSDSIMDTALTQKFPFILDKNLPKANGTENRVCTSCDTVVLDQCQCMVSMLIPVPMHQHNT